MADEITVQSSIRILKMDADTGRILMQYQTSPGSFTDDMTGIGGGGPGGFEAQTFGTLIDISEVDDPGWCEVSNFDGDNYVTFGVYDPQALKFYPLIDIEPGQVQCFKLARGILEEFSNTGTGTTGPTNRLLIMANTAPCKVAVKVFER